MTSRFFVRLSIFWINKYLKKKRDTKRFKRLSLNFNFYRGRVERSIFFFGKLSNFKFQNWNDSKRIITKQ